MPDDQRSSTASIVIVILVIVVVLGLAGLCACGGLGFFMLRSTYVPMPPPPTAVPTQPVAPPMQVAPAAEVPPSPLLPEAEGGEGKLNGTGSPKAERESSEEAPK